MDLGVGLGAGEDGGGAVFGLPQVGFGGQVELAADDDALGGAIAFSVTGQVGVVLADGVAADDDGVAGAAQLVDGTAGVGAGDPSAMTGGGGNFAVEGHGIFPDAEGALVVDAVDKSFVELLAGGFFDAGGDGDSGLAQALNAAAGDAGVGVYHADNDVGDACFDDGFGAGGGASVVVTGFEVDVEGCAVGLGACGFEGEDFGVGLTGLGVVAFADDLSCFDDD